MLISDLMSSPVHACSPGDTVSFARNLMLKHRISRVLVVEKNRVAGIITRKDIGYRLRSRDPVWRRRPADSEPVSSVMSADVLSLSPGSSIHAAMMLMVTHRISGFPVMDQGMILGIITKTDILKSAPVQNLDLPVKGVMHDVHQVTQKHSVDRVIDLMKAGCGKVVVAGEDGLPAGMISESDLTFAQEGRDQPEKTLAGEIMRSPVITLPDSARTGEVVREMIARHISSIIIVGDQGIKGIITRDDIIGEVVQ